MNSFYFLHYYFLWTLLFSFSAFFNESIFVSNVFFFCRREKVKSLEAGIEERDRELRRLRAEQDKLNMLNNSYKARIDKLRSELEEESKSKAQQGSAWDVLMLSSSGPNQQQQLIAKFKTLKRELTTKTEECEQLHLQVADLKNAHRFSSETLETRLQEMRTSCAERDEVLFFVNFFYIHFDFFISSYDVN
jgi:chromosome segregation ATPase